MSIIQEESKIQNHTKKLIAFFHTSNTQHDFKKVMIATKLIKYLGIDLRNTQNYYF